MNIIDHNARPDEGLDLCTSVSEDYSTEPVKDVDVQPPRRSQPRLAIVMGIAGLLLAYSQIHSFRRLFEACLPYAPVIFPSLIALGAIRFKDWNNYKPKWVRWVLVTLVAATCVGGVAYQHHQHQKKTAADTRSEKNIERLQGEVSSTRQAQSENTEQFLRALEGLSNKISALQTKAATNELNKELGGVRSQLENTRAELVKANTPKPKAKLDFSFFHFPSPLPSGEFINEPVTSIRVPVKPDGTVHVDLTLINATDVTAVDGSITIHLCTTCKFAQEPNGFMKLDGAPETERFRRFDRFHAMTAHSAFGVDLKVPRHLSSIAIGLSHRCANCVLIPGPSTGTVYLDRGLLQD